MSKKAASVKERCFFAFQVGCIFYPQAVSHSREFCHASPEIISGYSACFQQRRIKYDCFSAEF
jgi:hypothetical protein